MDYTKRFLSFLIDEIIFSVMSIVLMLILSHIGILKENFNFSIIGQCCPKRFIGTMNMGLL